MHDRCSYELELLEKKCNAPRVTPDYLEGIIESVEYVKHVTNSGKILRWAILNMKNGFSVTGDPSAAVSIENDREDIGQKIAYVNAFDKLWALEGYALAQKIYEFETEQADALITVYNEYGTSPSDKYMDENAHKLHVKLFKDYLNDPEMY